VVFDETWVQIDEFPDYEVSDQGRVRTIKTGYIKVPSENQYGVPHILLMRNGEQHRRGITLLVAEAFLPRLSERFNTPVNLNGDRYDNRVSNLVWRPRWWARQYNEQFRLDYTPAYSGPVADIHTGKEWSTSLEAAKDNGLLDREIFLAILNQTVCFPTMQRFRFVD
jgi:hypothetical protein